jgi:hypothetical protein
MSFCISKDDIFNEDVLGGKLIDLAGIVFRKHFYANMMDKEDLVSVGIVKALSLINSGNFCENKGTVLNYLYTGMRNEMHNYLYHQKKKIKVDDVCESTCDIYFEEECFNIDYKIVKEVCDNFKVYGDMGTLVTAELENRGFNVADPVSSRTSRFFFSSDFKIDLIDRLCGAVIWKNREFSHY